MVATRTLARPKRPNVSAATRQKATDNVALALSDPMTWLYIGGGGLLIIGTIWLGGKLLKQPFDEAKKKEAQKDASIPDSPGWIAQEIHAAAHVGPFGWTEDEDRIIALAHKICNYSAVQTEYAKLYPGNSLTVDLEWWLEERYQEFMNIVATNYASQNC